MTTNAITPKVTYNNVDEATPYNFNVPVESELEIFVEFVDEDGNDLLPDTTYNLSTSSSGGSDLLDISSIELTWTGVGAFPVNNTLTIFRRTSEVQQTVFEFKADLAEETSNEVNRLTRAQQDIYEKLDELDLSIDGISNNINPDIDTAAIVDNAVTTAKIADGSISTAKIADNAITPEKIINNSISSAKLVPNSVTSSKIANGSVTEAKLADASVSTSKLVDESINEAKLADSIISPSKLTQEVLDKFDQNIPFKFSVSPFSTARLRIEPAEIVLNDSTSIGATTGTSLITFDGLEIDLINGDTYDLDDVKLGTNTFSVPIPSTDQYRTYLVQAKFGAVNAVGKTPLILSLVGGLQSLTLGDQSYPELGLNQELSLGYVTVKESGGSIAPLEQSNLITLNCNANDEPYSNIARIRVDAHLFNVGDTLVPVYWDGVQWTPADALQEKTLATHVVLEVVSNKEFTLAYTGRVFFPNHGLDVGQYYYLGNVAGIISKVEADLFSNPLLQVEDEDYFTLLGWRAKDKTVPLQSTEVETILIPELLSSTPTIFETDLVEIKSIQVFNTTRKLLHEDIEIRIDDINPNSFTLFSTKAWLDLRVDLVGNGGGTSSGTGRDVNNILNYGADSQGVIDSSAALTACLVENNSCYIPEGLYRLSDVEVGDARVYGQGEIIRGLLATHAIILNSRDAIIDGLCFNTQDGDTANGTSDIKLADGLKNATVKNCKFLSRLYSAITADVNGINDAALTYVDQVDGFTFSNNSVRGSYSRQIYLHNVKNIKISNNDFRDSLFDSIRLRQKIEKCIITNNTFKDIGIIEDAVIERPSNWLSTDAYFVGDLVSVPPFGVYQCDNDSTIGQNPATSGSADWTNIAPTYFETKDIVDAFWSGTEFIFSNNICERIGSFGLDLKGTNPEATYSTGKIIISNNIIKRCFGTGINLSSADLDAEGNFHYLGEVIINGNYLAENNYESFDVAQAAIVLRQGIRNCSITNNVIEKNFSRGITVANLSPTAEINKGVTIANNHIISNGIPGHLSNIGLNISPVDGLVVQGNTIRNNDQVERYTLNVSGTATATGTFEVIESKGNLADVEIDMVAGETPNEIAAKIFTKLQDDIYIYSQDATNPRYYWNWRTNDVIDAEVIDGTGQIRFFSKLTGANGNDFTVTLNPIPTGNLFPQAGDFVLDGSNNLTITCRASTKPFNLIASFPNASAPIQALYGLELTAGTPADAGSQAAFLSEVLTLAGGQNANDVFFDTRLRDGVVSLGDLVVNGLTINVTENFLSTNSVSETAMNIRDEELVGVVNYRAPNFSMVVKDNICDNNYFDPRFNIFHNFLEPPCLIAYCDSDNTGSATPLVPTDRTFLAGGLDSRPDNHVTAQALLIVQGLIIKSRLFGEKGNSIAFRIDQPTAPDQPARVTIAPAYIGGSDIILRLPTDGAGDPVTLTREEGEIVLRKGLGQGYMAFENNHIGNGFRPSREGHVLSSVIGESLKDQGIAPISNNVIAFADIDGFTIDAAEYSSAKYFVEVRRVTDSGEAFANGELILQRVNGAWRIDQGGFFGDDGAIPPTLGVYYQVVEADGIAQVQYRSSDFVGLNYIGNIKFRRIVINV